ncbi:Uncharacterized protein SCF082_LOCUS16210, partial [Durusdinium trenchii]
VRARTEVQLGASRISMTLEVSHAGADEMEWEEDEEPEPLEAQERSLKRSRMLPLHLPHAGLQASLRCQEGMGSVSGEAVDASEGLVLEKTGLRLETFGFNQVKLSTGPETLHFRTLAPTEVTLQPG